MQLGGSVSCGANTLMGIPATFYSSIEGFDMIS